MRAIGKIGVILPEITDPLEYDLLRGITEQAHAFGYDVLIFTDTFNTASEHHECNYIHSMENIYTLVGMCELNGVVFASGRFHNKNVSKHIGTMLKKRKIPTVILEEQRDDFPYVFPPQRQSMYEITKHLIESHGRRNLYCITGIPDEFNSMERLAGFSDAMQEAGIHVTEERIFYGQYWDAKPYEIGRQIAEGQLPMPDGIVCANDSMAIGVCNGLVQYGVDVPNQIAVTGYDGGWYAFIHTPQITTISGRNRQLGTLAVCRLMQEIDGKEHTPIETAQVLWLTTSCGCNTWSNRTADMLSAEQNMSHYMNKLVLHYVHTKTFKTSDHLMHTQDVKSLDQLAAKLQHLAGYVSEAEYLSLCLCEDWKFDFDDLAKYRSFGFSESMTQILSIHKGVIADTASESFPTKYLLPHMQASHETGIYVLTSLHYGGQIFGYAVSQFPSVLEISVDGTFTSWCDAVSSYLNHLQNHMYHEYLYQQSDALSMHDTETAFLNRRGLMEQLANFRRQSDLGCLMIAMLKTGERPANDTILTANAIRISSEEDELLCRLNRRTFMLIFRTTQEQLEAAAEQRIGSLYEKIHYFYESSGIQEIPKLHAENVYLPFEGIAETECRLMDLETKFAARVESAMLFPGNYSDRLQSLRRHIYSTPQEEWTVEKMADELNVSISHMQRIYKNEFNISCNRDIIKARIQHAQKLLQTTDLKIYEVAARCGYQNANHFMRQFKEQLGVSALRYRRSEQ